VWRSLASTTSWNSPVVCSTNTTRACWQQLLDAILHAVQLQLVHVLHGSSPGYLPIRDSSRGQQTQFQYANWQGVLHRWEWQTLCRPRAHLDGPLQH
jgi:hypothetical protein